MCKERWPSLLMMYSLTGINILGLGRGSYKRVSFFNTGLLKYNDIFTDILE